MGEGVGYFDGWAVGAVGACVGEAVGYFDGWAVGAVGACVGAPVGCGTEHKRGQFTRNAWHAALTAAVGGVGDGVGTADGAGVGASVGDGEGLGVGSCVGSWVGLGVGAPVRIPQSKLCDEATVDNRSRRTKCLMIERIFGVSRGYVLPGPLVQAVE